jgi:hypothetical protein
MVRSRRRDPSTIAYFDHSPSTALVMMLRWISLEPPKIETLR